MKQTNFQVLFDYKDYVYIYILIKAPSQYLKFSIFVYIHTKKQTYVSQFFDVSDLFFLILYLKKKLVRTYYCDMFLHFQRWKRRYFKLKGRKLYYAKDTKVIKTDEFEKFFGYHVWLVFRTIHC